MDDWNKFRPNLMRWADMIACGVTAAVLWLFISPFATKWAKPLVDHLSGWPPSLTVFALAVLAAVVAWPLGKGRWLGFFGLRYFWQYPPLWVAILSALVFLTAIGQFKLIENPLPWVVIAAESITVFFLALYFFEVNRIETNCAPLTATAPAVEDEFLRLRNWLLTDTEISNPHEAKYDHLAIAKRIVERIKNRGEEAPTIALVGPLDPERAR